MLLNAVQNGWTDDLSAILRHSDHITDARASLHLLHVLGAHPAQNRSADVGLKLNMGLNCAICEARGGLVVSVR